jgi:hypothetical protein
MPCFSRKKEQSLRIKERRKIPANEEYHSVFATICQE